MSSFPIENPVASAPAARCPDRLVCTRCGAVTRLDLSELVDGVAERAASHGYAVEAHALTVRGRCWVCRAGGVRA